jgi:adenylosuccinate synthase
MVNGFTEVNLTKLDVLTGFDEVKIGVKYVLNGKEIKYMPSSLVEYSNVVVEYESMPGWKEDISKAKKFEDLPLACQTYVLRLEELMGVHIRWIGVGPGRDDVIERKL